MTGPGPRGRSRVQVQLPLQGACSQHRPGPVSSGAALWSWLCVCSPCGGGQASPRRSRALSLRGWRQGPTGQPMGTAQGQPRVLSDEVSKIERLVSRSPRRCEFSKGVFSVNVPLRYLCWEYGKNPCNFIQKWV